MRMANSTGKTLILLALQSKLSHSINHTTQVEKIAVSSQGSFGKRAK
jgi:hypothetical protein